MGGNTSHIVPITASKEPLKDIDPNICRAVFVTEDFDMGDKYGIHFNQYYGSKGWLQSQGTTSGNCLARKVGDIYVYYLVVKKHSYTKIIDADVDSALTAMKAHADSNAITDIAMPYKIFDEISHEAAVTEYQDNLNPLTITFIQII